MTTQEAINVLEKYKSIPESETVKDAFDIAISAIEKQIQKKPKMLKRFVGECPNCGAMVEYPMSKTFDVEKDVPHCKWCGQALDWGDTK